MKYGQLSPPTRFAKTYLIRFHLYKLKCLQVNIITNQRYQKGKEVYNSAKQINLEASPDNIFTYLHKELYALI